MTRFLLLFAAFLASAAVCAETEVVTLSVPDMTCSVCPLLVKQSLLEVDGVLAVEADLARREATVTLDAGEASPAELVEAAREAGYASSVVHTYVPRGRDD